MLFFLFSDRSRICVFLRFILGFMNNVVALFVAAIDRAADSCDLTFKSERVYFNFLGYSTFSVVALIGKVPLLFAHLY